METTRVGLEYLQVNANKIALQELCNKKDEKFNKALEEFEKSMSLHHVPNIH